MYSIRTHHEWHRTLKEVLYSILQKLEPANDFKENLHVHSIFVLEEIDFKPCLKHCLDMGTGTSVCRYRLILINAGLLISSLKALCLKKWNQFSNQTPIRHYNKHQIKQLQVLKQVFGVKTFRSCEMRLFWQQIRKVNQFPCSLQA